MPVALVEGIRALLSIFGQNVVWYFSWNLLEVQVVQLHAIKVSSNAPRPHDFRGVVRDKYEIVSEIGREGRLFQHLAYVAIGFLALIVADAMVASSWINPGGEEEIEEENAQSKSARDPHYLERRIFVWARSILALGGQVCNQLAYNRTLHE